MTGADEFKSKRHDEEQVDYFYLAIVVSLVVHLFGMLAWNVEKHYQILPKNLFSFLHHVDPSRLLIEKKEKQKPKMRQVTFRFVDVNPEVATVNKPKQAKFEGARNSVAANEKPTKQDLGKPKLDGKETEMIRDRDANLAGGVPVRPKPPSAPKPPAPKPPEKVTEKPKDPEKPKPKVEQKAPPTPVKVVQVAELKQPKPAPPAPQLQRKQEPAPPPKLPEPQPLLPQGPLKNSRPRSLPAARRAAKNAGLPGRKSKMDDEGVKRKGVSALDVLRTAFGEYGELLHEAMSARWHQILEQRRPLPVGTVVVTFRVHQSGRVSNVKTTSTEVNDLHTAVCQMAIRDPSPYPRWPTELVRRYPNGYHDITVRFIYR